MADETPAPARPRRFRVKSGVTIYLGPAKNIGSADFPKVTGPMLIREDQIDSRKVPGYLASGALVLLGDPDHDDDSISGRLITHDSVRPQGGQGAGVGMTDPKTAGVVPPGRLKRKSIYNLNPDSLKGKSLEALNLLLIERNSSAKPVASVDAAIALLSEDYGA